MTTHFVRQTLIDPRIAPVAAIAAPLRWRRAWFPTPTMGALSLLLLALFIVFGWRFFQWGVVHAHWLGSVERSVPGRRRCVLGVRHCTLETLAGGKLSVR